MLTDLPPPPPGDDFIARASREFEAERAICGGDCPAPPAGADAVFLLRRAAAAVAEVNQSSPVPVTVTDYALLLLADSLAKAGRRQVF